MCPMKVNKPLIFAALVLAPIQAFASPNAINAIEVQIGVGEKLGNYCSGGLEDRKLIERSERISNPFKQTTQIDCKSAGGTPLLMPDLPSPSADSEALV